MAFELEKLVRENVRRLAPYSSARSEFSGVAQVYLDANENSFGSPVGDGYNRYPDPLQAAVKARIASLNQNSPSRIFLGNGSDEAIDLLFRIFCRPGIDNVVICPPTYGMYEVSAGINDVGVRRAPLTAGFDLDPEAIENAVTPETKLIFICSPNNPTGNSFTLNEILDLTASLDGIVVVDEAYIQFSGQPSLLPELDRFPNLVILQTFSKAWGLAGLRTGLAFASEEIIRLFNRIKPPYNVGRPAQELLLRALNGPGPNEILEAIIREREALAIKLSSFAVIRHVFPSDANFLLVRTTSAEGIYRFLLRRKIVVRKLGPVGPYSDCLRITVGTPDENAALIEALKDYETMLIY